MTAAEKLATMTTTAAAAATTLPTYHRLLRNHHATKSHDEHPIKANQSSPAPENIVATMAPHAANEVSSEVTNSATALNDKVDCQKESTAAGKFSKHFKIPRGFKLC